MMDLRARSGVDAFDAVSGSLVELSGQAQHGMIRDGLFAAGGFENQVSGKLRRDLFQVLEMLPGNEDVLGGLVVDH